MVSEKDLPWIGRTLYEEGEAARTGGLVVDTTLEIAQEFVCRVWKRPDVHIEVIRRDGRIVAVCGVTLARTFIPPQPLVCVEWLWWGETKKETVQVWERCKVWGKSQGAEFAQYAMKQPQRNSQRLIETARWVKL